MEDKLSIGKNKMVVKTLHANVLGLEKGTWLYYNPETDNYEFKLTKNYTNTDIGYYSTYHNISCNISRVTVDQLIGNLFEYVIDPFVIGDSTKKEEINIENTTTLTNITNE